MNEAPTGVTFADLYGLWVILAAGVVLGAIVALAKRRASRASTAPQVHPDDVEAALQLADEEVEEMDLENPGEAAAATASATAAESEAGAGAGAGGSDDPQEPPRIFPREHYMVELIQVD